LDRVAYELNEADTQADECPTVTDGVRALRGLIRELVTTAEASERKCRAAGLREAGTSSSTAWMKRELYEMAKKAEVADGK
jgi:hypothetical protein